VILNGHEYVVVTAQDAGMGFAKEGNCFTRVDEPDRLAQIADTLSQPGTIGRLSQLLTAGSIPRACVSGSTLTSCAAAGSATATRTRSTRSSTAAT
jgi:hypothetical protein